MFSDKSGQAFVDFGDRVTHLIIVRGSETRDYPIIFFGQHGDVLNRTRRRASLTRGGS
jgi:hypothetical protein